jgi:two-component system nitrate/nitrite response regulator NarL
MTFTLSATTPQYVPKANNILLVEDNPLYQKQITAAISACCPGSKVSPCLTGLEALEQLKNPRNRFDLVLVDLGLPDISGLEVIRAARKRFSNVPIMVISSITSESSLSSAIRAGARGYILKSDSDDAICQAIVDVLNGNYPISPSLARSLFKLAGAPGDEAPTLKLSRRETETLQHLSCGYSYVEVAEQMGVKVSTVQSNVRILYRKLEAKSQMQAVVKARDAGVI